MLRIYSVLFTCLLALLIPSIHAQDVQHRTLYGQGVHEYYNGNYEESIRYFTTSIDKKTDDPRTFYFRGLANAKIGRTDASVADLKAGADLEARDKRGIYQISAALQRVQGQPRLQIEKFRREARTNLVAIERARLKARYEQQQANEAAVLRKPSTTAPSIPVDAQSSLKASNPFAPNNIAGVKSNPKNVTVSKVTTQPGVDDKDPLGNVLGNNPANQPVVTPPTPPATNNVPAAANPFAPGNAPAATPPPAAANPFAPGNAPAATPPPAAANPFAPGNAPAATPPANNDPVAPGNAPAAGNAAPAAKPPAADGQSGGTLGAILRSLNPFGGSAAPNADETIDKIKNLIPGGSAPAVPEPGNQPAPNKPGAAPFGGNENPFDK